MATSHGSAISAAKRVKLSPLTANASRLVRLETGSSSEAVFDRWVQAYTCGLAPSPQPGGGGEHHRGEQHHRGVQAQHGRDHRGQDEDCDQQPPRPPRCRAGHPRPASAEQSLVIAQLGEHQHRGQESDHRAQPLRHGARLVQRDRTSTEHHSGGRDSHHSLRPTPRPYQCPGQHPHEQNDGQGFRERGVQDQALQRSDRLDASSNQITETANEPRAAGGQV